MAHSSSRRSLPSLMTMTDAARERARELLFQAPEGVCGLRVSIEKGGCAGMAYRMDYVEEVGVGDEEVLIDDIRLYIAPADLLFLFGARMDYQVDDFAARFVFDNPNATDSCGCGESVSLLPATLPSEADGEQGSEVERGG